MENENKNVLDISFNISEEQLTNRILEKIECKITQNILNRIESKIANEIKTTLDNSIITMVENKMTGIMKKFVDDIYNNTELKIPKARGYYSENVEFETIILKDYVLKKIHGIIENGSYDNSNKTTLVSYLQTQIDKDIVFNAKRVVENEVHQIRDEVNKTLKTTFDTATKQALSEQVFNVLMASETYKNLENSIKLIGTKNQ